MNDVGIRIGVRNIILEQEGIVLDAEETHDALVVSMIVVVCFGKYKNMVPFLGQGAYGTVADDVISHPEVMVNK